VPLRPIQESDLDFILDWRNSPAVRNSMYNSHVITREEHRAWFENLKNDASCRWFLHSDKNGTPDGVVYFKNYDPNQATAFWGFYASPFAQSGSGNLLGEEGLNFGFNSLKLHKINAEVLGTNERSLKLHRRLGFKEEGNFKKHYFNGKAYIDIVRLALFKSEWCVIK